MHQVLNLDPDNLSLGYSSRMKCNCGRKQTIWVKVKQTFFQYFHIQLKSVVERSSGEKRRHHFDEFMLMCGFTDRC